MSEMKNDSGLPPFEPEDIPELRRKGRLARNALLLYFAAGLAVAFLTPENILQYPWARSFVNFMSFIPYVEQVEKSSFAHPIAPFFAAVMSVLSCVMTLFMWRAAYPLPTEVAIGRIRVYQILKYGAMTLVVVAMLVWLVFYPNFDTRIGRMQISSRLGMGLYGVLLLTAIPVFLMGIAMKIKNWRYIVYGDMDALQKRNSKFY